jgi:tetratricopeptide (TPR) repeat protein
VKWVLIGLSVVVAGAPTARSENAPYQSEPPLQIKAGDAALQKFDLDGALAAYREAYRLAPDNYEAAWKLARALADKGTLSKDRTEQKKLYIEAELIARDAVRLNPADSKGHTYLAIAVGKLALYEGGKRKVELSKEVKTEAERAIELNPKEDLAWHVLGIWNREMVELNFILRAFAEFFYGKFPPASLDEALKNLRRAAELAPEVVPHHVELGVTLASTRKWPEAKAELEKALAMPKGWVTDPYYISMAKETLKRIKGRVGHE